MPTFPTLNPTLSVSSVCTLRFQRDLQLPDDPQLAPNTTEQTIERMFSKLLGND